MVYALDSLDVYAFYYLLRPSEGKQAWMADVQAQVDSFEQI
jgi:hypothetical protein